MMTYHELLKIVNPKRAKVKEMNEKLAIVRAELAAKQKRLREVQEKINELDRLYKEKIIKTKAECEIFVKKLPPEEKTEDLKEWIRALDKEEAEI
jgi:dynein heavy chain